MIKKIAWDTFKHTGDINTFLELKEIENAEKYLVNDNVTKNEINIEKVEQNNIIDGNIDKTENLL
ncbi:MAG: hypothetical protein EGQ16_02290 [Clostridiales bacterium]|nr:hypothetical protein [Clostridiales bacterium]